MEILKSPFSGNQNANYKRKIYEGFLNNARTLETLGMAPVNIGCDLNTMTADVMFRHQAKWHRSCKDKFANSRVQKAKTNKGIEISSTNELDQPKCSLCKTCSSEKDKMSTISKI